MTTRPASQTDAFLDLALANPLNGAILERLPALAVDQPWLTAGCLYQAVWNARDGRDPAWGIKDYDIFYWDDDTSWEAEDIVIKRADCLFADMGANIEVRNQARVPLWFEARFGATYPVVTKASDGIKRFLVECTCIGMTPNRTVHAPFGLADLFAGRLVLNRSTPSPALFEAKAKSYQNRWPWLEIVPPDAR